MPDCIQIREAVPADLPALAALLAQLFAIEADFTPDTQKQTAGLKLILDSPEAGVILVAEAGGEAVAMVSMQILVSTAQGTKVGMVEDMVVRDDYRGKGIGSRLLSALENLAAELGLTRLQLLADKDNAPALAFYQKNNWLSTSMVALKKTP